LAVSTSQWMHSESIAELAVNRAAMPLEDEIPGETRSPNSNQMVIVESCIGVRVPSITTMPLSVTW